MSDLQVSIALALENQEELQRALQAAGGRAGEGFSKGLTPKAQQAFDEFVKQADKTAKEVGLRFSRTNLRFETVSGSAVPKEVIEGLSRINKGFREAAQSADVFQAAVGATSKEAASNLNLLEAAVTGVAVSLTQQLSNATIGGLAGLKGLIGGFMELDGELRLAAAAAGETGGYERLGTIVDKVGIEAAATTKQVAELATSLVRAGFSVSEVEEALPGVVRGAEATGTSLEKMGDIVGNTLRGFGLEVDQTARVTDVLVNAANSSNASIEGLGYTFEYAAPLAKALGVSLEDVAAAAGLMANAGIQGSVAGTGLRSGLQKLQQAAGGASPEILGLSRNQDRLAAAMKKLGASVTDAKGDLLPLNEVFLRLKASLSELSRADQVRIMNILFGEEAGSKFLSITNQSTAAINKMFSDMKNSAGATNTARTAMAGFGLEVRQLEGTLQSIGSNVGGVLAAALRGPLQLANAAAGAISGLPTPIKATAGALVGMAGAATAASVGIGALNVVVGSIGGWAAMRAAIASVATVITGPLGAGTLILFGLGAAAGVLTGHFKETDRTTKTLIQTAVGLGTFVAVLKGITTAQVAWNNASKAGAAIQILLTSLTPGGLAKVAIAAALAAGAYYFMGKAITVTGEETTALTDKSKTLKDEITSLGQQIEQNKKLKIDTTDLEKVKAAKELDLQALENPLEIKLNIQKAEGQIKSLQEQRDRLGKDAPATASLDAQIKAAEKYRDVLKAAEEGVGSQGFAKLDAASQRFVKAQQDVREQIQNLMAKKIELPINATADRADIDKNISELQAFYNKNEIKFKAGIDTSKLQTELEVARAKLEQVNQPLTRIKASISPYGGTSETASGFAKREAEQKQKVAVYTQIVADLQLKLAAAQGLSVNATEQEADAAAKRAKAEKDRVEKLKLSLEASKFKVDNQQRELELGDKLLSIDKNRLSAVRELADSYLNLANAQAGLVQSQFDVKSARTNRASTVAEQELQTLKEDPNKLINEQGLTREQVANRIRLKEQEIIDLKNEAKRIENDALAAAIQGAAKRFEIERKVLELKQMAERMEAQAAVRASQRASIEARGKLIDLQIKQQDTSLTPQQKQDVGKQIELQKQMISLSDAQVAADKESLAMKEQKFAMEKDILAVQKQQEANQFRSKAAGQGVENMFTDQLANLDKKAGQVGANKMQWQDIVKGADKAFASISKHNEALQKGTKNVANLAKEYQQVGIKDTEIIIPGQPVEKIYEDVVQVEDATKQAAVAWGDVDKAANKALGTVKEHIKALESGKKVGDLIKGMAPTGKKSGAADSKTQALITGTEDTTRGMVSAYQSAADQALTARAEMFNKMIEQEKEYRKKQGQGDFTSIATPNFLYMAPPKEAGQRPPGRGGLPWYDKQDLAGIMKIEKATGMAADQFFDSNQKATALGRTLLAIGKDDSIIEREKYYSQAIAEIVNGRVDSFKLLKDIRNLENWGGKPIDSKPSDWMAEASKLARKQNIGLFSPFAGDEAAIDKIAANIADADAKAKGLKGAIEGVRDEVGRPIDTTAFNFNEIHQNFLEESRRAFSPEAIKQAIDGKGFSLKPTVDTSAAQKDLGDFKQQESKDPIELSVKPAGFDSSAGLSSIRGPVQAFIDQLETTGSFDQAINFKANGLDQIRNDLGFTSDALNGFSSDVTGVDQQLSSSFLNASNALLPLSDQIRGIGVDFQNLNTGTDPFAAVGTSLGDAADSSDGINGSLQAAIQSVQGLDQALANNPGAEQLQQAYDSLQPPDVSQAVTDQALLADGTQGTVTATQGLADSWVGVADNIRAAVDALAAFNTPQAPARFAGGGVEAAHSYTVNELGPEAFLSATGALSRIRAPQYGHWVAPSRGLVLPAGITARLDAMGAFEQGSSPPARQMAAAVARPRNGSDAQLSLVRLQRSIDRLEKTMGTYRPPTVEVHTPSNAGLLHTMQGFR